MSKRAERKASKTRKKCQWCGERAVDRWRGDWACRECMCPEYPIKYERDCETIERDAEVLNWGSFQDELDESMSRNGVPYHNYRI